MGFLDPNIWGAKQGRCQNFGSGENQKKFIHEFFSRFTAMASPKFRFWRNIQQKCTHQRLLKIFKKIYNKFAQKLKNSSKFVKNKI